MYKVEITHKQDLAFSAKAQNSEFIIDAHLPGATPHTLKGNPAIGFKLTC
jgi:hypothetical protein